MSNRVPCLADAGGAAGPGTMAKRGRRLTRAPVEGAAAC